MRNKRCLATGCYRNPHYGVSRLIDPNSKAQYCTQHKAPGMQNVNGGRCAGPDCSKQPRFSLPGQKGKYCSKHREEGMVDVLYTPCAAAGCKKHPHFGFIEGGPRFCAQHRAQGMVDVKHRRCAVKGCRLDRIQIIAGCRKRGKFCEVHTSEQDAFEASSEGHAQTDREVSSSDGASNGKKRERDLKAEIEDESVYMSSEGSQRGASMDDIGSGLFDSPAGRSISMMPGELASSACQGYPSAHAEMRQRTFAWNVEAAVPRDRIRTLVEIKRRRETHDHSMAVQASRGAVDADIDEGGQRGAPTPYFYGVGPATYPYPLFQRTQAKRTKRETSFAKRVSGPLPFSSHAKLQVRPDVNPDVNPEVKPFRLRCEDQTPHSSDMSWYPCPWEFTREDRRTRLSGTTSRWFPSGDAPY
ncbi:unnamed protein product [Ascophyllum nodosum]